jgi:hypothetical protein
MMKHQILSALAVCLLLSQACRKSMEPGLPPEDEASEKLSAKRITAADSVIEISEALSGPQEASRLQQSFPASDFTPTGFYLPPNTPMVVKAEQVAGAALPKVLVGTYSRYKNKWNPTEFQLHNGNNTITDSLGGLIYLRYITSANPASRARISFVSGKKPVPFYVLGKTTHAAWLDMLNQYTDVPDVQLVSNRTIMVASRANALQFKDENQDQVLRTADRVINIEDSISGLDGATERDRVNVHKYLMTETDNEAYYMVATWYRTAYFTNTLKYVLTLSGLGTDGWGPWHELGHMHQQGAWTWGGLGEVTVNVYSLAVERTFGITPSRLRRDNVWAKVDTYLALPDSGRDFNGSGADVWVRLAMFHQLWLAFNNSFYHQLHKQVRLEKPSLANDQAKMRYFMLAACNISGKDLSDFFRKWGFKVPDTVYGEIAALGLPAPAVNITTLQD